MAKRKRESASQSERVNEPQNSKNSKTHEGVSHLSSGLPVTIQIVAGSYDRVLHGVLATITPKEGIKFADSFLFNAHSSAIRCLALSPPSAPLPGQKQKVMLATGSTDERINVYNLSAHPPRQTVDQDLISSITPRPIAESSKNREVGTLLHHSSTVTKLSFPTRSKLLSASEDSTIGVTRTRDWSLLSAIKTPVPRVQGRPSGDTATMGGTPSGVNDFAIHPSMKLMITVSKGERCMRLWNLVTGKKAGVLNFGRDLLQEMDEGKHSTGEGRKVVWGTCGGEDEFAVSFDRNILVFSMDSRPKCRVMPDSRSKVHELCYVKVDEESDATILAVSTEDGKIMFFSTRPEDLETEATSDTNAVSLRVAKLVSQLGGKEAGVSSRVKDFSVLPVREEDGALGWLIVSGCSDGKIRVWKLDVDDLRLTAKEGAGRRTGKLLGTYETQNRITCVEAFVMIPRPEGVEDNEDDIDAAAEDVSDQISNEDE